MWLQHHYSLRDIQGISTMLDRWAGHPWTPFAILGIYVLGGITFLSHAILLWATVLVFDPWHSILYAGLGTYASGLTVYAMGRTLRPGVLKWLTGSYLGRLNKNLASHGLRTLILFHWFPICPFSVLNFLAGATHISLRDFVLGTVIGSTPGIIVISFFGHQIRDIVQHQQWLRMVPVACAGIGVVLFLRWLRPKLLPENKTPDVREGRASGV